jgi:hypothetical protein
MRTGIKTTSAVILLACGSFLSSESGFASPPKKAHFFSNATFQCGGFDQTPWGECTDLRNTDLAQKKNKSKLEKKRIRLTGSTIEGKSLSLVHFDSAQLDHMNFRDATLSNISMTNTQLQYADLRGTKLNQVKLLGTIYLHGAVFDNNTDLSTLCDDSGLCGEDFAFANGMIYLSQSSEYKGEDEIAGAHLQARKWDPVKHVGWIELGAQTVKEDGKVRYLHGPRYRYEVASIFTYVEIMDIPFGTKVRAFSKGNQLAHIAPM